MKEKRIVMPAGKQQEENVQEPKNNGEKNDLVKGRTLFMDKRYRKRIFYGLVAVVAIGVTIDTLFISPSTSPPTANELNKMMTCSPVRYRHLLILNPSNRITFPAFTPFPFIHVMIP